MTKSRASQSTQLLEFHKLKLPPFFATISVRQELCACMYADCNWFVWKWTERMVQSDVLLGCVVNESSNVCVCVCRHRPHWISVMFLKNRVLLYQMSSIPLKLRYQRYTGTLFTLFSIDSFIRSAQSYALPLI